MPEHACAGEASDDSPGYTAQKENYAKRDPARDVLEKVSLIKDISIANPHRGHLDVLASFSLDELARDLTLELSKIDANRLTPLEAHAILARLAEQARGR